MWNLKTLDTDKALYIAIADALERDVRSGVLKPGQKMPTHRDLAEIIGVNVTTVTRAYKEAERRGLIAGTVGRGTYITADAATDSSLMKIDERTNKIIELGLVLPLYNNEIDISIAVEKLLKKKQLNRFLRYTDPLGLLEHREAGAYWVKRFGINVSGEDVVICAGAQHALNCCLSSLFEPGDRIAADYLTYPGIKAIAKNLGIKLEPISMDKYGMVPESLENACQRNKIKGLYLMPSVQNPTTAKMSLQRRKEIADIIERRGLMLIEDDIYNFADQNKLQAITTLVPQNSVYIASVSKAFYAGLRVAYVITPKQFRNRIAQAVLNTIWMVPTFNVELISECIRDGTADQIIALKLQEISKRFDIAKESLSGHSFSGTPTSFFLWLNLPEHLNAREIEFIGRENGINVISSEKFAIGGDAAPSAIRLSLSGAETIGELNDGLNILNNILSKEYVKLDPIL